MEELVKSPCIRICKIDNTTGLCIGCLRTITEISDWIFLSEADKLKLLAELDKRRDQSQKQN